MSKLMLCTQVGFKISVRRRCDVITPTSLLSILKPKGLKTDVDWHKSDIFSWVSLVLKIGFKICRLVQILHISFCKKQASACVGIFWNYFNWETSTDLLFPIPLNFSLELWKYFMNFQKVFIQRFHFRCHGQFTIKSSRFNDFWKIGTRRG